MIKLPSQFTTLPHCLCKLSHVSDTEEHKKKKREMFWNQFLRIK